jgi:L-lactate dehydrogenase (cytochrome)
MVRKDANHKDIPIVIITTEGAQEDRERALALGANACSIGRGYLYPLAAGGQAGVERGLTLLRGEVERTLALLGCDSIEKLRASYVRQRV